MKIQKLGNPEEPIWLKEEAKREKEGSDINIDSLVVWFGLRLPKYLWDAPNWKNTLKSEGYTWQSFLCALKWDKKEIIRWLREGLSWDGLLEIIKKTLDDPILKKLFISAKG